MMMLYSYLIYQYAIDTSTIVLEL